MTVRQTKRWVSFDQTFAGRLKGFYKQISLQNYTRILASIFMLNLIIDEDGHVPHMFANFFRLRIQKSAVLRNGAL